MTEFLEITKIILEILGPIGVRMIERAVAGEDPLAVLASEHVADIIPAPLLLELAEKRARLARQTAATKPPSA